MIYYVYMISTSKYFSLVKKNVPFIRKKFLATFHYFYYQFLKLTSLATEFRFFIPLEKAYMNNDQLSMYKTNLVSLDTKTINHDMSIQVIMFSNHLLAMLLCQVDDLWVGSHA